MDLQQSITRLVRSRRILVLGSSGTGKTSLTRQLCDILDIEPIHLDAYFWKPGWQSTPQNEWRDTVVSLVNRESWIMDGTYESTLHLRMPAADSLIVLERSRFACLWRVIKRKATVDDSRRPDAPPGQKLDLDFLRYVWRYPSVTRPFVYQCIRQYASDKPIIVLDGASQVRHFLSCSQDAAMRKQRAQQRVGEIP
jgi:adenylate kinase family enzyme